MPRNRDDGPRASELSEDEGIDRALAAGVTAAGESDDEAGDAVAPEYPVDEPAPETGVDAIYAFDDPAPTGEEDPSEDPLDALREDEEDAAPGRRLPPNRSASRR